MTESDSSVQFFLRFRFSFIRCALFLVLSRKESRVGLTSAFAKGGSTLGSSSAGCCARRRLLRSSSAAALVVGWLLRSSSAGCCARRRLAAATL
jgi:hypothetical protein